MIKILGIGKKIVEWLFFELKGKLVEIIGVLLNVVVNDVCDDILNVLLVFGYNDKEVVLGMKLLLVDVGIFDGIC